MNCWPAAGASLVGALLGLWAAGVAELGEAVLVGLSVGTLLAVGDSIRRRSIRHG